MANYDVKRMYFSELEELITIPPFQRSLIWNKENKMKLLSSIHKKYPFGTLLLYDDRDSNKLQLIDGLQRFSTLKEYKRNPLQFIFLDKENEMCKHIDELFSKLSWDFEKNEVYERIESTYIKTLREDNCTDNFSKNLNIELSNFIKIKYKDSLREFTEKDEKCIDSFSSATICNIKKFISINDILIPVIIYQGDEDSLSEIYSRLNTVGTKLTDYDIYAALWSSKFIHTQNKEIKDFVIESYRNKYIDDNNNTSFDISEDIETRINKYGINCYELLNAMSQIIKEKYKVFNKSKYDSEKKKPDSKIAFLIVATILSLYKEKMVIKDIPKELTKFSENDLDKFINAIFECAEDINNILLKWVKFGENNSYHNYIEIQLVAIFCTYFYTKHNFIIEENEACFIDNDKTNKKIQNKFEENMPKWYLYEIISEYWSHQSTSFLYKNINEFKNLKLEDARYIRNISSQDWKDSLNYFFKKDFENYITNISSIKKLFLVYFYNYTNPGLNGEYDIEHIIPKETLKKTSFKNEISISCISNLCYLPKNANRSKKNNTIYEINNQNTRLAYNEKIANDLFYPKEKDINFCQSRKTFSKSDYNDFLKNRWKEISKIFVEKISKNSI